MRRPLVFLLIGIAIGVLVVRYHEPAIDSVRDVLQQLAFSPSGGPLELHTRGTRFKEILSPLPVPIRSRSALRFF